MARAASAPSTRKARLKEREITIVDAATLPWRPAGKEGLALQVVRENPQRGHFLGNVGFEAMARSGLHQHQGVATSYFARGGLTDYSGSARLGDVGINFKGSTHDAIAYEPALLVSRLEGPVTYPEGVEPLHGLHVGATHGAVENPAPDVAPEINVPVAGVVANDTGVVGFRRKTVFDYAGTGDPHRMLQWLIRPGSVTPRVRATALTECWVYAGDLLVNGQAAHANCYVIIEPGTEFGLASRFGALVFAWLEGCPAPVESPVPGLFGY